MVPHGHRLIIDGRRRANNRNFHRQGPRDVISFISPFIYFLLLSFYLFWKLAAYCTVSSVGFLPAIAGERRTCHPCTKRDAVKIT